MEKGAAPESRFASDASGFKLPAWAFPAASSRKAGCRVRLRRVDMTLKTARQSLAGRWFPAAPSGGLMEKAGQRLRLQRRAVIPVRSTARLKWPARIWRAIRLQKGLCYLVNSQNRINMVAASARVAPACGSITPPVLPVTIPSATFHCRASTA